MEHMKGEEFTIDLMFDFESKPVAGLVRRRIETKGGLASKAEVVIDKQALGQAYEIGNALKIIGPANMQFLKVGSRDSFFDLNPRFSGALARSHWCWIEHAVAAPGSTARKSDSSFRIRIQIGENVQVLE